MTIPLLITGATLVAFAWYAIRRWRLRVFLVREIRKAEAIAEEREACLSCGLPKRTGYVCHACGFCGVVTVQDEIRNQDSRRRA